MRLTQAKVVAVVGVLLGGRPAFLVFQAPRKPTLSIGDGAILGSEIIDRGKCELNCRATTE